MKILARFLLSCGGIGFLPKGSWITALLASCLWSFGAALLPEAIPLRLLLVSGLALTLFIVGAFTIPLVPHHRKYDHKWIVLDELLGTLIAATPFLLHSPPSPSPLIATTSIIVTFGFFDGLKPLGIRRIDDRDDIPITVMLDDVVAGVYAAIVIGIGQWALGF